MGGRACKGGAAEGGGGGHMLLLARQISVTGGLAGDGGGLVRERDVGEKECKM